MGLTLTPRHDKPVRRPSERAPNNILLLRMPLERPNRLPRINFHKFNLIRTHTDQHISAILTNRHTSKFHIITPPFTYPFIRGEIESDNGALGDDDKALPVGRDGKVVGAQFRAVRAEVVNLAAGEIPDTTAGFVVLGADDDVCA
jgi:hypothetical protein